MRLGRGPFPAPVVGIGTATAGLAVAALAGCTASAAPATRTDPVLAMLDVAWSEPISDAARMESLVAECMAQAGFTYVPTSGEPAQGSGSPAAGASLPSEPGYGIATGPRPAPPAADPNAATVAALSPAEQQAYRVALEGEAHPAPDGGADDGAWQYDWQRAGCRGSAQHQVYGDPAQLDDAAALEAELAEARLAAASDPRVDELDAAWAACMAASGYAGYTAAQDAEASVQDAWDALWAQAWSGLPSDPSASDVAAAEAAAEPAVAELAAHERVLAAADRTCRDQVGYDDARDAVTAEYQDRFYQAHRAALEEWLGGDVGDDR